MRVLVPPPRRQVEPLAEPPTFSIVIAAFQAAATIGVAIRSALQQTHPAHEVIVVDDGSTDDIAAVLTQFGDRIRTIRQENRGAAAARNTGAAAASGEFMAILDADDAYHPRRLEALAELARMRPDLDLVTTDARLIVRGKAVGTFTTHTPFVVENQRTAIFDACFIGGWPAIRLTRLRAIGGFDESFAIGEDWDCWLRALLDGATAGLVEEPYYDYAIHPGSLTMHRADSLWGRVRLLEKAGRNPSLRAAERPLLERALQRHRSRAVETEVQAALYASAPRSKLPRLALSSGIEPRARLLAAAAWVVPPLPRRIVPQYESAQERLGSDIA